jgi:hypothetical protein
MLGAAFRFIGELLGEPGGSVADSDRQPVTSSDKEVHERIRALLTECMERTDDGGWRMSVRFADATAIDSLVQAMARIAAHT